MSGSVNHRGLQTTGRRVGANVPADVSVSPHSSQARVRSAYFCGDFGKASRIAAGPDFVGCRRKERGVGTDFRRPLLRKTLPVLRLEPAPVFIPYLIEFAHR